MKLNKRSLLGGLLGLALLAGLTSANAVSLTLGDSRYLGFVEYGIPSGDQDRQDYVNYLIDMTAPSGPTADPATGQTYTRSANYNIALPDAVWAANGGDSGSYNVGSGGYLYMFAKYDGPNYGSAVWYIGGLTGDIDIPTKAGKYGLSGVSFFNPGGNGVPDGGMTAILLGLALTGISFLRRRA